MKNLQYIGGSETERFRELVACKRDPGRSVLEANTSAIIDRLNAYHSAFHQHGLGKLTNTPKPLKAIKDTLLGCYASPTQALNKTKSEIRKAQPWYLQGTCQFCGINEDRTIDHYVPKDEFPEFSAMALNLFPMCFDCNNLKRDYWREVVSGERGIVNLYGDQLPEIVWLICVVEITDGLPIPKFSLKFPVGFNVELQSILERHYQRFKLLKRYQGKSNGPIGEIEAPSVGELAIRKKWLRESLEEQVEGMRRKFGTNYWKAALYAGLGESEGYLEWAVNQ